MTNSSPPSQGGTQHPYIEQRPEIAQGKPVITGTRIKVSQIALEYERLGWTPDQIVDAHPHLSLAQVHDALSYYYDHQTEIDADLVAEKKLADELRQRYPAKIASVNAN
jgi:uncharacterized protein (DUF433 family)